MLAVVAVVVMLEFEPLKISFSKFENISKEYARKYCPVKWQNRQLIFIVPNRSSQINDSLLHAIKIKLPRNRTSHSRHIRRCEKKNQDKFHFIQIKGHRSYRFRYSVLTTFSCFNSLFRLFSRVGVRTYLWPRSTSK